MSTLTDTVFIGGVGVLCGMPLRTLVFVRFCRIASHGCHVAGLARVRVTECRTHTEIELGCPIGRGESRAGPCSDPRRGLWRPPGLACVAYLPSLFSPTAASMSSIIEFSAENIRPVNSSLVSAITHEVGKSNATTRICRWSSSARSLCQSASDKRYSRSTCSTKSKSPA